MRGTGNDENPQKENSDEEQISFHVILQCVILLLTQFADYVSVNFILLSSFFPHTTLSATFSPYPNNALTISCVRPSA